MIFSVLDGLWDAKSIVRDFSMTNYYFGLSSGVVDVRLGVLPYPTKRLLELLKTSVAAGTISPFSGEMRSRDREILESKSSRGSVLADEMEGLRMEDIISMNWLNDNIDGRIPKKDELSDFAKRLLA